jgi:hypothetical protein
MCTLCALQQPDPLSRRLPLLCCCCWRRGPGQIVGDTSFGKPAAAAATVRARSRMRVLLVRHADAAALVSQPSVKAALYRTQTESSVLDALETFAAYDGEVAAIDEVRRSRAASFALATRGGLVSMGSGVPGLSGAQGSGQWLGPASSIGSSLESYGSVASSLANFTAAVTQATGQPVSGRSSPLPAAVNPSSSQHAAQPSIGGFSLPARVPSKTAGSLGAAVAAEFAASAGPVVGSGGGSPLRPGSRGTSFTAGSTTPRGQGGLRGTISRLGLAVPPGGGQYVVQGPGNGSPLASPRM